MYAIETANLSKYYGKSRGIIDVNLQIKEGEIFGFIGPNGAGKSTTIRTLLNLIFPTGGSAKILGHDSVTDSKKIKLNIGYLPGEVNYYSDMKVKDLLQYSAGFYDRDCSKRINELVEIFEVDTMKKIDSLSLGNKKKIGIVQALLHKPKLLILDEPTSGLDPLMQKRFFDVLEEENKKGTTIFFSSHILSEVQRFCSRVAIIKEGRILRVEDIERLRGRQFKKVRISFKNTEGAAFKIDGMNNAEAEDRTVQFLYDGPVDTIIRNLSSVDVENLWIEEPSLDEIFIHYYEKEGN